jgi:hypothetical protein
MMPATRNPGGLVDAHLELFRLSAGLMEGWLRLSYGADPGAKSSCKRRVERQQ